MAALCTEPDPDRAQDGRELRVARHTRPDVNPPRAPRTENLPAAPAVAVRRPWLRRVLAWGLGLALLGWLLQHWPVHDLMAAMARPDAATWVVTLAGLALSYLMRAARLQVVTGLSPHEGRLILGLRLDALRVILMHNAAVNLLPMRAGEASFPWLASRELGMPLAQSVACLLWMRLQDVAVLVAAGLLVWPGLPMIWRGAGLLAVVLGWRLGLWVLRHLHERFQPATDTTDAPAWKRLLARLHEALLSPHHQTGLAWFFTVANWAIKLTAGAWLLSAITRTPLASGWLGALGGELAAIVPVQGPAGFGTYEAGVWAGMALKWPPGSDALAAAVPAALALHFCFLLCAMGAGAAAWVMSVPPDERPRANPTDAH